MLCCSAGLSAADNDLNSVPLGLKKPPVPSDNPMTEAKVALGKQLYFDKRLSADNTVSCASCHDPAKGWSNGEPNAEGIGGQRGGRNSPTVLNTAYNRFQFWDGRAGSLEEQALGPIANPIEMNLPIEEAVKRLQAIPGYRQQFQEIFGGPVNADGIAKSIAAFERTVLTGDAAYDRFKAGDQSALSPQAQAGMKLFFGKANCSGCHGGSNFTDNAFHNLGVGITAESPDLGRIVVSQLPGDRGAFKTPSLRDIERTAPYMHDGSLATLEDVVDYYNQGGTANAHLDEEIYPLNLNDEQKASVVTFLKEGLAGKSYPLMDPPSLPE